MNVCCWGQSGRSRHGPKESAISQKETLAPSKMHRNLAHCDAVGMVLECLLLANNGLPGHVACTSALPPTADIQNLMSAFVPISSALPLKADVAAVGRESPKLTQRRHSSLLGLIFYPIQVPKTDNAGCTDTVWSVRSHVDFMEIIH